MKETILKADDFLGLIISHTLVDKLYGGIGDLQSERSYVNEIISDILEHCCEQGCKFSEKIPAGALFNERLLNAKTLLLERMEGEKLIIIYRTSDRKLRDLQLTDSLLQGMFDRLESIKKDATPSNGGSAQSNGNAASCKSKLTVVKQRRLNEDGQTCPGRTFRRTGKKFTN